jgi:hypothetical protein
MGWSAILYQASSLDIRGERRSIPLVIRPERRDEDWPPENLLIKWRSHAGCGFNQSTMCLL